MGDLGFDELIEDSGSGRLNLSIGGAQFLRALRDHGGPLEKDLTCVGDPSWDHMRI